MPDDKYQARDLGQLAGDADRLRQLLDMATQGVSMSVDIYASGDVRICGAGVEEVEFVAYVTDVLAKKGYRAPARQPNFKAMALTALAHLGTLEGFDGWWESIDEDTKLDSLTQALVFADETPSCL